MEAELSQGKGDLGALGDPDAVGVPKKHVEKAVRTRNLKKKHEPPFVPPLVSQVAGFGCSRCWCGCGSGPAGEKKKQKLNAAGACERKRPKLRTTQTAAISQPKPAVVTGKLTMCCTGVYHF
ncbi:hypothetical protein Hanom_Chr03g00234341 [Helianthus anomalus]